jgi:hypothetical protein
MKVEFVGIIRIHYNAFASFGRLNTVFLVSSFRQMLAICELRNNQ